MVNEFRKKKKEKLIEITFAKNRVILLRVSTSILNRLFFFRVMEQLEWNEIDGGYIYIYIRLSIILESGIFINKIILLLFPRASCIIIYRPFLFRVISVYKLKTRAEISPRRSG